MKSVLLLVLILFSGVAFAGGTGPGSLVAPAVNVTILVCALIYFLKTPAKAFFSNKSSSVSEMLERASSKAKEAEMMMEVQRKKAESSEQEIKKLEAEHADMINSFDKNYQKEVEERIVKMKEDANQKIESERKELVEELNANLLDLVVAKAKNQIKNNPTMAETATKNIIEGL